MVETTTKTGSTVKTEKAVRLNSEKTIANDYFKVKIGTTNKIELIDPAVLRTGRMDIHVEICPPDKITRKKMFDLYLKDRPCIGVDTEDLADKTDKYSSSDISFIVNDAALVAAFKDSPIDQNMLLDSINNRPSSLGVSANKEERKRIGFT